MGRPSHRVAKAPRKRGFDPRDIDQADGLTVCFKALLRSEVAGCLY